MNNRIIINSINSHISLANLVLEDLQDEIIQVSELILNALINGKKVVLFGNGGSAADSQHIAAELSGRFLKERKGLAGLALTTDTSVITAIGNDYGFDKIFERQVEALCNNGDVLIGISTSGNSKNVIRGLERGKELDCITVGLTGNNGGKIKEISDFTINIDSKVTARIQEMHILVGHIICEYIDHYSS